MATDREPKSFVDEMLGEEPSAKPQFLPQALEPNPATFNRHNLAKEIGGLLAFAAETERTAVELLAKVTDPREFSRATDPVLERVAKIRRNVSFYESQAKEKGLTLEESELESFVILVDTCNRVEALFYDNKVRLQTYPNLQSINDPWVKKILQVPDEILDFRQNTPVLVYEYADLREVSKKVPVIKAFEHNFVLTVVYRDMKSGWDLLPESEKIRLIKVLKGTVGKRLGKVRLVDSQGNLLGQCKNRKVEVL